MNRIARLAALLSLLGGAAAPLWAQQADVDLNLMHVQGNVYMLHAGAAGNSAVQIGEDGVLIVNALRSGLGERIAAEIAKVTSAPIRYIVNTSDDLHNTSGNSELAALGTFGSTNAARRAGATLVAHENVMLRLVALTRERGNDFPMSSVPLNVYILPFKDVYFNGEPVFIMHEPQAHTDGDSIVLFRKSDTIAVGDLFIPGEYPVIDVERGGNVQGLLRALHHVLDLAVPERLQDGGTRIIPGRGRLANEADVVEYRNMVAIVRDRVRDMIERGMSLNEIQASRPTLDYDNQYGSGTAFVESIYQSLSAAE